MANLWQIKRFSCEQTWLITLLFYEWHFKCQITKWSISNYRATKEWKVRKSKRSISKLVSSVAQRSTNWNSCSFPQVELSQSISLYKNVQYQWTFQRVRSNLWQGQTTTIEQAIDDNGKEGERGFKCWSEAKNCPKT